MWPGMNAARVINWNPHMDRNTYHILQPLYLTDVTGLIPLTIRGDGNCLLNSVHTPLVSTHSLTRFVTLKVCAAMWGIQDRRRTVRTVMLHGLLDDESWNLKKRWAECEARGEIAIGEATCSSAHELREWLSGVHGEPLINHTTTSSYALCRTA